MALAGAIAGAVIQSRAARRAANAQQAAANADIAYQTETRDMIRADLQPFVQGGTDAQNALAYLYGLSSQAPTIGRQALEIRTIPVGENFLGSSNNTVRYLVDGQIFTNLEEAQQYAQDNATGGEVYGGFQASPMYDFTRREGLAAVEASAAARGGLYSGATMQALQQRGDDLASQEWWNYTNALAGMASAGQNAAGMNANAAQNTANAVGNAYGNIGNAQAAGAIAQGNAWNNAINNGISLFGYQNALNQFGGGRSGGGNWLFGGNSWG